MQPLIMPIGITLAVQLQQKLLLFEAIGYMQDVAFDPYEGSDINNIINYIISCIYCYYYNFMVILLLIILLLM